MKMDFKNFLKNYGRIRENFRGFFGRLFVGIFAEFNEKFGEFKMGFLNFAMKNSAKFLDLLNFKANLAKSLNLKTKNSINSKALLNLKAKNSSITKTKKGLLYENENPA